MAWWIGIVVGLGVMAGHMLLCRLTHRWSARRAESQTFLLFELGGMGVRMILVLSAVGLVLAFVPVPKAAFVGTVIVLLIVSVIAEVQHAVRHIDWEALED